MSAPTGDEYTAARTRVMIVAASVSTVPIVLFVVSRFLDVPIVDGESGGLGLLVPLFAAVAVLCALAAPVVQRRMLPSMPAVAAGAVASPAPVAGRITIAVIIPFAVAEVASLLGFVLYVLGAGTPVFLGCLALTLASYAACFPTPARFASWVEAAAGRQASAGMPPSA